MTRSSLALGACATWISAAAIAAGCSCGSDPATGPGSGTTTRDAGRIATLTEAGIVGEPGGPNELCPEGCQCSDGVDNDGDGQTDGIDAECTGAYDDDEGTFATGIPGDNIDESWQDCFFDGNSGAGDDGCMYRHGCLTGELAADDRDCQVSAMCLEFCKPRTPNGCDCFGCCDVTTESGAIVTVHLREGCSLENVDDETACPRCTRTTACDNACGTCELCPGRDAADLPAECYPDPDAGVPMYTCDDGQVCTTTEECGLDYYCQLGCCVPTLI
jgi:hypothetical protein